MVLLSSFPQVEGSLAGQDNPVVAGSVSWSRGRPPSFKCVLLAPCGRQLVPAAARADTPHVAARARRHGVTHERRPAATCDWPPPGPAP
jgi:hypothetical protein